MIFLQDLEKYLNELLQIDNFSDYAPNGIQVEGRQKISRIATGVTASQQLLEQAIEWGADAILVHHGYFWRGEAQPITGIKRRRIKALLDADVSLLGYHLPLDAHPKLGNNAQLASRLGFSVSDTFANGVAFIGELDEAVSGLELSQRIASSLSRSPLHIAGNDQLIKRVAWCSGGAQGYLEQAAALGVDAYITGEASEQCYHNALELGVHFYAAGHHATERYGVQVLGEHLAKQFEIEQCFFDSSNPI